MVHAYNHIDGITVDHVDVSGFFTAGIASWRMYGSVPFITNFHVTNSRFHNNPGGNGQSGNQGSGVMLASVQKALIKNGPRTQMVHLYA